MCFYTKNTKMMSFFVGTSKAKVKFDFMRDVVYVQNLDDLQPFAEALWYNHDDIVAFSLLKRRQDIFLEIYKLNPSLFLEKITNVKT